MCSHAWVADHQQGWLNPPDPGDSYPKKGLYDVGGQAARAELGPSLGGPDQGWVGYEHPRNRATMSQPAPKKPDPGMLRTLAKGQPRLGRANGQREGRAPASGMSPRSVHEQEGHHPPRDSGALRPCPWKLPELHTLPSPHPGTLAPSTHPKARAASYLNLRGQ